MWGGRPRPRPDPWSGIDHQTPPPPSPAAPFTSASPPRPPGPASIPNPPPPPPPPPPSLPSPPAVAVKIHPLHSRQVHTMNSSRAEASRLNGAKSRGPKTENGRRASSLNAIKHGLTAETVVLPNESEGEYEAALTEYLLHFTPANQPEADLVRQLASASWRLARYTAIETSLFDIQMEKDREYVDKKWKSVDGTVRLALAFESLSGQHSPLALLNRYQARLHHEYQRILKALLQLQAARRADEAKLQNEPKPLAQAAPDSDEPMQPTTAILPYWKTLSSNGLPPTATSPS